MSLSASISTIDIVIVVIYLLGVTVFGVWVGRGQRGTEDYFLGARSLPWWALLTWLAGWVYQQMFDRFGSLASRQSGAEDV